MVDLARTISLIESKLAPYVGAHMAAASTKAHVDALKLGGRDELTVEEAEALLTRLTKGLRIFVGGGKADQIDRQIRSELDLGGRA